MPSITLAESAKLAQDDLVAGVIETIITVNPFFDIMPFDGIDGNALAYNRENVMGDAQFLNVGGTITAKNPATFTKVTSGLTTILGDAEVNGLIQATRSGDGNDQKAIQIASKAKSVARQYQDKLVNGDGTGNTFEGMLALCAPSQKVATATNGSPLSFELLDELLDKVKDKDGQVDYIMMHRRTIRSYRALWRALGGTTPADVIELPSGRKVPHYNGIPIFANDWLPTNQVKGTAETCTTVFAGTLDDGSRSHGITGLTAEKMAGINVKEIGELEDRDESLTRIKWYCGFALFSELGLAAIEGVTN